ncbi:class I SAM-dependent methyltransferase [Nocardia alni]|uniref:class I SAM-dependent methyltransferase n=1 Tax=Nocardia alni TaxID=2815723 RepID=UPI001C240018|nr:class I SAM-dependent methyltransferase [Nocardia alni]
MTSASDPELDDAELRARRAGSFGPAAAAYEEHRPDYPPAAIRWALEPLGPRGADPDVLDLAAGTGKLTAGLVAAGTRVRAVEPDEAMRAAFAMRLPDIEALAGTAESIPLPDGSVDAVLVGQALHWFDQERAFPEIARVLRPGGVFAALWNMNDTEVEWVAELERISIDSASFRRRTVARGMPSHPLFQEFAEHRFPHTQRRTAESLAATIGTHSHTLVVSPRERAELLGRVTGYLREIPETADGEFELPLRTLVIRTVLR